MDLLRYVFGEGEYYKKEKEAVFKTWEQQEWRRCNREMIVLSEHLKELTFELTCREEDKDWRMYYSAGDSEICIGDTVYEKPTRIKWDDLCKF